MKDIPSKNWRHEQTAVKESLSHGDCARSYAGDNPTKYTLNDCSQVTKLVSEKYNIPHMDQGLPFWY